MKMRRAGVGVVAAVIAAALGSWTAGRSRAQGSGTVWAEFSVATIGAGGKARLSVSNVTDNPDIPDASCTPRLKIFNRLQIPVVDLPTSLGPGQSATAVVGYADLEETTTGRRKFRAAAWDLGGSAESPTCVATLEILDGGHAVAVAPTHG